jgi:hypothetical protein
MVVIFIIGNVPTKVESRDLTDVYFVQVGAKCGRALRDTPPFRKVRERMGHPDLRLCGRKQIPSLCCGMTNLWGWVCCGIFTDSARLGAGETR